MKQTIFLLILIFNSIFVLGQENKDEQALKKAEEIARLEAEKRAQKEKEKNIDNSPQQIKKTVIIKELGHQEIKEKPNKALNKKGIVRINSKNEYEEFEYENLSDRPVDGDDIEKKIHIHCPPFALNVGYSSLYLTKSKKFEDNIELQGDWMLLLSLSLRATFIEENQPHFTFFTGINAVYLQAEYGFSGGDYHAIRLRRSFNFYLGEKAKNNEYKYNYLYNDYTWEANRHYHYQAFISNIFIEPIVEFRFSKNSQKNEFVIGLAFGVSF